MPPTVEADVCIVGSGLAGAIVAKECLDAGRSVVMLEAGPRVEGRARKLRILERTLRSSNSARMRIWYRNNKYLGSDYQSRGSHDYPLTGFAVIARGGATLGWTGFSYRMRPEDFKLGSLTGLGQDWPIDYNELQPFYQQAEVTLSAKGNSADDGHPPRSVAFPNEVNSFPGRDQPFIELFAKQGWSTMHHNSALASDGGIFTADELLDQLETRQDFSLLTGVTATAVVCDSADHVTGIEACPSDLSKDNAAPDGSVTARATDYVLCAGGIETPTLLLQSVNQWHPDGLGNHSGHVGRHLASHGGVNAGVYPDKLRVGFDPAPPTAASRQFDTEAEQASGKYVLLWRPNARGAVFFNACVEQLPDPDSRITLGVGKTHFGSPKPYIHLNYTSEYKRRLLEIAATLSGLAERMTPGAAKSNNYVHAHPMCTTRMSSVADQGVVDRDLRVHSVENLHICGSGVFTTGAAAHPTVTIAALAHRLGQRLAGGC